VTKVFTLQGAEKGEVKLPSIFGSSFRPDLIRRAVLAAQSARRQPYGVNKLAGKRTSALYHGVKDVENSMKNREVARGPRSTGTSPGQEFRMRFVPQAVGGRQAHPPKAEKKFTLKLNEKEQRLALASAIAATADAELVKARGHRADGLEFPIIVESAVEHIKKAKDVEAFLRSIRLEDELERANVRKIRAGRGKMRGRKHRTKKSVLFVVAEDKGIGRAGRNLPGTDVMPFKSLTVESLAPGGAAGRLTVWSEDAIKKMRELYG
jgi:large subunit ribosomal protein L4e